MTRECLPVEDLEEVRSWPEDDPRREHIAGCPRCRSLLDSYALFLRGGDLPGDAAADVMDRRLQAALEREIFPERRMVTGRESRSAREMTGWEKVLDVLTGRRSPVRWRGALAVAAAITLVVVGLNALHRAGGPAGERIVLRQEAAEPGTVLAATVEVAGPGEWLFRWVPVDEADGYALIFLGTDLAERSRREVLAPETSLRVAEQELASPGASPGSPPFWQVLALRDGDEIAHSRPQPLARSR